MMRCCLPDQVTGCHLVQSSAVVLSGTASYFLQYWRAAVVVPGLCMHAVLTCLHMPAGWCVWFFTVLAGAALLVVNTKLVHIVRYVTHGGHVHRLKPGIFWLNRWVSRAACMHA